MHDLLFRKHYRLIVTLVAITLLATTGCNPAKPKSPTAPAAAAESSAEPTEEPSPRSTSVVAAADPAEKQSTDPKPDTAPEPDGDTVVIKGDLNSVDWTSLVGKSVTIQGDLVIVDTYDLARRGQIKVARERLYVPTSQVDPNDADPDATSFEGGSNVAKVVAAQKFNDKATIMLDDTLSDQNIIPPTLFPHLGKTHQTVRVGSVIHGASGKLINDGKKILLVSDKPLKWTPSPRPKRPSVGKADTTVASFNVLNFFTTLDDGQNDARGADTESELKRQETKIVSAITELQADVIGLMELENNIDAENRLVDALNKKIGKEVFKGCGLPEDFRKAPGGDDAIRVGIIYRTDRVSPVGDVSMIHDSAFHVARTPVVQSFKSKDGDRSFTVIVNHFKSKGSSKADKANKNKGDGQGAYNAARRAQALAITNYIDELGKSEQPRVLVIGDLNAYQQEDPIDALRAKGLIDLHQRYGQPSQDIKKAHYSYVFRGQSGSLDHAMATESLAADVTGIATWHINADEPRFLDYNEEYNPKTLFEANPYRSSDHDPVLIGIRN